MPSMISISTGRPTFPGGARLALPTTPEGYDYWFSITDKFSKTILLAPGKITVSGKMWAGTLLDYLTLANRDVLIAILSDQNRTFVG